MPPASVLLDQLAAFFEQQLGPFTSGPEILVDPADQVGLLQGYIILPDGCEFHVRLTADTSGTGSDQWAHYGFHCQDRTRQLVVRFDNAPHHPGPTFPHHVHRYRTIDPHPRPTGREIVDEVMGHHSGHGLARS